jgi:hypothetical protein
MTDTKLYRQVELVSGKTFMICWLPSEEGLRVGNKITLDGDDSYRLWTVNKVFSKLPMPINALPQEWKVGGIDYVTGRSRR